MGWSQGRLDASCRLKVPQPASKTQPMAAAHKTKFLSSKVEQILFIEDLSFWKIIWFRTVNNKRVDLVCAMGCSPYAGGTGWGAVRVTPHGSGICRT